MTKRKTVRNANGTTRTYHGEEAETVSAKVANRQFSNAQLLAMMVPAPTSRPVAKVVVEDR